MSVADLDPQRPPVAFHTIAWRPSDVAVVAATYLLVVLIGKVLPIGTPTALLGVVAVAELLAPAIAVLALARRRAGAWVRPPPLRRVVVEVALAVPLLAGTWICTALAVLGAEAVLGVPSSIDSIGHSYARSEAPWFAPFTVLVAVGMAPIVEELVFRGLLLGALARWMPFLLAAVLQAVLFAALHPVGPAGAVGIGTIGLSLALVHRWRRTLVTPMAMHAMQNSVAIVLAFGSPTARPVLGVHLDVVDDGECRITSVVPGSAADRAGLQADDVVRSVNAEAVSDTRELQAILQRHRPGDPVRVSYERAGQRHEVDAVLGEAEPGE